MTRTFQSHKQVPRYLTRDFDVFRPPSSEQYFCKNNKPRWIFRRILCKVIDYTRGHYNNMASYLFFLNLFF